MSPFPVNKHGTNRNKHYKGVHRFYGDAPVTVKQKKTKIELKKLHVANNKSYFVALHAIRFPVKLEFRSTAYQNAPKCSSSAAKKSSGRACAPSPDPTLVGSAPSPDPTPVGRGARPFHISLPPRLRRRGLFTLQKFPPPPSTNPKNAPPWK